jgi:hypothetical protein
MLESLKNRKKSGSELLEELREAYENEQVSALVGSGFSKNASKVFPLWSDLLADIIAELYNDDLECLINKYVAIGVSDCEAKEKAIRAVIDRVGSLEIVSEYIRRKGFGHESIDCYIESHVPSIYDKDGHLYIEDYCLTDDDLIAHKLFLECKKWNNIYTTNYDQLLEKTRDYYQLPFYKETINSAYRLSGSISSKSIIKIHGDMANSKYEFDGDKNLKYIIAKEDYEAYPGKHEPFTSLMRLSMLQGRFCLIGFSGSDPNYLSWLQWMKDVLDKDGEDCDSKDYTKVFLILSQKEEIEPARELFYRNHHVQVLNLSDDDVIEKLFDDSKPEDCRLKNGGSKDEFSPSQKESLIQLFKYLQSTASVGRQHIKSSYNSLWSDVYRAVKNNEDCSTILSQLLKERSQLGTPKLIHYQDRLIDYLLEPYVEWSDIKLRAFTVAMDDCGLLPCVLKEDQLSRLPNLADDVIWKHLQRRERTFACEGSDNIVCESDDCAYEAILRSAYLLDFTLMKNILSKWTPSGHWIPIKASMCYLFDRQASVGVLDEYIRSSETLIDRYKASVLCNAISGEYPERYQLSEYWDKGLDGVNDVARYIAEQSQLRDKKIYVYGQTEQSICLNPSFRSFTESLRLLQYFVKEGFMPTMQITTLLPAWDWYHCFVNIFEIFPYPALFYTLCYHDEKLARKVGQEYAYSEDLKDELAGIQQSLLKALGNQDAPHTFRKSLLLISKEMYCALDEGCWFDLFEANVLLPYLDNITSSSDVYDDIYKHVCSAIDNIYSPERVLRVLRYLVEILPINTVVPSSLISNFLNIRSLPDGGVDEALAIIDELDFNKVYAICYSLNHYNKLPEYILTAIRGKISKEDILAFKNNPSALVQISSLFSDNEFVQLVKSAVLESNVWDCGIREKMRVRPNVIQLEYFPKWYIWENQEREILFENMKYNLSLIENLRQQSDETRILLGSLVDVVYSMLFFFSKNTGDGERGELDQKLKNELMRLRGFDNVLEGFVSDDPDKYDASRMSLLAGLTLKGVGGNYTDLSLELDRALFEHKVCLNRVLSNIAFYCTNYKDVITLFSDRLLLILDRYRKVDFRTLNLNKPSALSSLYRIAFFLSQRYPNDVNVKYWIEDKAVIRFNLVKFWQKKLLNNHM